MHATLHSSGFCCFFLVEFDVKEDKIWTFCSSLKIQLASKLHVSVCDIDKNWCALLLHVCELRSLYNGYTENIQIRQNAPILFFLSFAIVYTQLLSPSIIANIVMWFISSVINWLITNKRQRTSKQTHFHDIFLQPELAIVVIVVENDHAWRLSECHK